MSAMLKSKTINYLVTKINNKNVKIPVHQLDEPFPEEMKRIRFEKLSPHATEFAYSLESLPPEMPKSKKLEAKIYRPITKTESDFYSRYSFSQDSPSIGIVITNIDKSRIQKNGNGEPKFYQMRPNRRTLALAQRALFFDDNHNQEIYEVIEKLESGKTKIPSRPNRRSATIEEALGIKSPGKTALYTPAISELGYKKISSDKFISRRKILRTGLLTSSESILEKFWD